MKLKTTLILLLLMAPSTYSQAILENWSEVSEIVERAGTSSEFLQLQKKYPEYFSRYDPKAVGTAEIKITEFIYTGKTHCLPQDSRLKFEGIYLEVCSTPSPTGSHDCDISQNSVTQDDPCEAQH